MAARILLVEDDPVSQDYYRAVLEGRGHAVDVAGDGFAGVRLLQTGTYDLVLVDYHLPDLDGYAAARLMRGMAQEGAAPRLVALTVDRAGLAARCGAETVFDAILGKPIEPRPLLRLLDAVLGGSGETAPALAAQALLDDPGHERARAAAAAFWRERGLAGRPTAAAVPPPSAEQALALGLCFEAGEPATADLVVLLERAGLDRLPTLPPDAAGLLVPIVDATGAAGEGCDAAFRVGDPATWSEVACLLQRFDARRARLSDRVRASRDRDTRLLARLYLAERPLRFAHDPSGRLVLPHDAWISATEALVAAERLAAHGFLGRRLVEGAASGLEFVYELTERALVVLDGTGVRPPEAAADVRPPEPVAAADPVEAGRRLPDQDPNPLAILRRLLEENLCKDAGDAAGTARRDGRRARILVAEDVDVNREIARAILEAAGHVVDLVADGVEAVAAVRARRYGLVLMDVQMPGLDGLEATRRIRALPEPAGAVPIVGLTASALPGHAAALREAGMDDHIVKPLRRDDLCAAVARWHGDRADAPDPVPPLDRATYDGLLDLVGPHKVRNLLDQLAAQLTARFQGEPESGRGPRAPVPRCPRDDLRRRRGRVLGAVRRVRGAGGRLRGRRRRRGAAARGPERPPPRAVHDPCAQERLSRFCGPGLGPYFGSHGLRSLLPIGLDCLDCIGAQVGIKIRRAVRAPSAPPPQGGPPRRHHRPGSAARSSP